MCDFKGFDNFKRENLQEIRAELWKLDAISAAIYAALDAHSSNGTAPNVEEMARIIHLMDAERDYIANIDNAISPYI